MATKQTEKKLIVPVPRMLETPKPKEKIRISSMQFIRYYEFNPQLGYDQVAEYGILDDLNDLIEFCNQHEIDVAQVSKEMTSGYPPHYTKYNNVSFGRVEDLMVADDTQDSE